MPATPLRRVLVVQHVQAEPLGTLAALLRRRRVRVRYHNAARHPDLRPQLGDCGGVIVLGGPQNLDEQARSPHLRLELDLVGEAVARGVPVLGICLGAQILAHALGAAVGRCATPEHGWADLTLSEAGRDDAVTGPFGARAPMFHWHGRTFDLPPGATLLGSSERCAHQAFRIGAKSYGLQFHPEVDAALVGRWLHVYAADLDPGRADAIAADTLRHVGDLQRRATAAFAALIDAWGWQPPQRAVVLGHRMTGPLGGGL